MNKFKMPVQMILTRKPHYTVAILAFKRFWNQIMGDRMSCEMGFPLVGVAADFALIWSDFEVIFFVVPVVFS